MGDEVLRRVAKVLRGAAREMDMVVRYGGEEFVVILPGTTAADVRRRSRGFARRWKRIASVTTAGN